MNGFELSVVIPAYNEADVLERTLCEVERELRSRDIPFEVIVADDGSTDGTLDIAQALVSRIPELRLLPLPHRGKGHAVKRGMLQAAKPYRLFMDADHSTHIRELEKFLPAIAEGYEVVIGSRKMQGAKITLHQPLVRELMGKGFTRLTNALLTGAVTDITCGFKCFTRRAAEQVFALQRISGWGFDAEILFLARRYEYRVKEIPVVWGDDPSTQVRLLGDTVRSLQELMAVRMWAWQGRYDGAMQPFDRQRRG